MDACNLELDLSTLKMITIEPINADCNESVCNAWEFKLTHNLVASKGPESAIEILKETVSEIIMDTVRDTVSDTVSETVSDTVRETVSDTVSETVSDTVRETVSYT